MIKTNCTVCGLPKEACLHQRKITALRKDKNVLRLFWFTMGFITALSGYFFSCSTDRFVTAYRITTPERNYYVNHFKVVDDTIFAAELKRNGNILKVHALPWSSSEIQESK